MRKSANPTLSITDRFLWFTFFINESELTFNYLSFDIIEDDCNRI